MKSIIKMMLGLAIMGTMPMMVACSDDDKEAPVTTPTEDPKFEIISDLLDPPTFSFSSEGQKAMKFDFNTNQPWKIELVNNQPNEDFSWLTLFDREGEGKGATRVWISADQNKNTEARRAQFTLTCGDVVKTFFVYQAPKHEILVTDPKAFMNLNSDEQVLKIELKTNVDAYNVDVSDKTWMEQVDETQAPADGETRAMYDETIYVKVKANATFGSRGGSVKITDSENNQVVANVTVTQFGLAKPTIAVNNAADFSNMTTAGASIPLDLTTTEVTSVCDQLTVDIPSTDKDWISFQNNEDNTGFILNVAPNTGGARQTTVSVCAISDHTVKYDVLVKQEAANGVLINITNKESLKENKLDKKGGALVVKYGTETDNLDWDCKIYDEEGKEATWMKIMSKKIDGQLILSYDENENMVPRTATIKVFPVGSEDKADYVTVEQAKGTCVVLDGSSTLEQTLKKLVQQEIFEDIASITSLELKGELKSADWTLLKTMLTSGKGYKLNTINLEQVTNTKMAAQQFVGCSQLKSIVFPAAMREMGERVCQDCSALNSAKFPEGIEYVANHTFNKCSTLKTVWIPSTMGYLYGSTFEGCSSLSEIHLQCYPLQVTQVARSMSQPTTNSSVFNSQERTILNNATLYVPSDYVSYYRTPDPQHVSNSHLKDYLKSLTSESDEWTKNTPAFDWKPGTAALKGQFRWVYDNTKVKTESSWDE